MGKRLLLVFTLLCAVAAFGQGMPVQLDVKSSAWISGQKAVVVLPGATVQFYLKANCTALPCTAPLATYADVALTQPLALVTDADGNLPLFYVSGTAGEYRYTVTAKGITTGPYSAYVPLSYPGLTSDGASGVNVAGAIVAKTLNGVRSADRFASLQAAHDDLPLAGGMIYLPCGTYGTLNATKPVKIVAAGACVTIQGATDPIVTLVGANSSFVGNGAQIVTTDAASSHNAAAVVISGAGSSFEKIRVVGPGILFTGAGWTLQTDGVSVTANNVTLRDVETSDHHACGVVVTNNAANVSLLNNYAHDNGYCGANFDVGTVAPLVQGGTYATNGGWNGVDGYGVSMHSIGGRVTNADFHGNLSVGVDAHPGSHTMVIANNTCEVDGNEYSYAQCYGPIGNSDASFVVTGNIARGKPGYSVNAGIYMVGYKNAIIANNLITSYDVGGAGIYVRPGPSNTSYSVRSESLTITGNVIDDLVGAQAILIDPTVKDMAHYPRSILVTNNHTFNAGGSGGAVKISYGERVTVERNQFKWDTANRNTDIPVNCIALFGNGFIAHGATNFNQCSGQSGTPRYNDGIGLTGNQFYSWEPPDVLWRDTPTTLGMVGLSFKQAGTFGTLTGVTGTTTAASNQVTVNVLDKLLPGNYIAIAGETFATKAYVKVVEIDATAKVLTLAAIADVGVTGAAVSFSPPTTIEFGAEADTADRNAAGYTRTFKNTADVATAGAILSGCVHEGTSCINFGYYDVDGTTFHPVLKIYGGGGWELIQAPTGKHNYLPQLFRTAGTYDVAFPSKSGTVAFTDDIPSGVLPADSLVWHTYSVPSSEWNGTFTLNTFTPHAAITVERVEISTPNTLASCTTSPVISVMQGATTLCSMTLANGAASWDSYAANGNTLCTGAATAGTSVIVRVTTAGVGCTGFATRANINVQYHL